MEKRTQGAREDEDPRDWVWSERWRSVICVTSTHGLADCGQAGKQASSKQAGSARDFDWDEARGRRGRGQGMTGTGASLGSSTKRRPSSVVCCAV